MFSSIRKKMLVGFGVIIVLTLMLSSYFVSGMKQVQKEMEIIIDEELNLLVLDEKMAFNIAERIALARGYLLTGDSSYKKSFEEYVAEGNVLAKQLIEHSDSQVVHELVELGNTWSNAVEQNIFPLYEQGKQQEAIALLSGEAQVQARQLMSGYNEMTTKREDFIIQQGHEISELGQKNIIISSIFAIVIAVLSVIIALIVTRSIVNPIHLVKQRLEKIAAGDLADEELAVTAKDEIGVLMASTNTLSENNNKLLIQIQQSAHTLQENSADISQATSDASEGSEQVAMTMGELAVGAESEANLTGEMVEKIESFTHSIHEINKDGQNIAQQSQDILFLTAQGQDYMNESSRQMNIINTVFNNSMNNMENLSNQTKAISQLTSVIHEISDQTNLLSLNAAIEAARAGEMGKGFAVVADEVKKLAEQVSSSVGDITQIIESIQNETIVVKDSLQTGYKEVEKGSAQMLVTGETFSHINDAVHAVTTRIQNISSTIKEVTDASESVKQMVEEVSAVTEQSAAGIEETAAATEEVSSSLQEVSLRTQQLVTIANGMTASVDTYKLRGEQK